MSDKREQRNQVFTQGQPAANIANPGIRAESAAEKLKREFGIEIPAEVVTLPSGGAIYPPESGLHLKKDLMIKPMSVREEDILTSRALIKKGTVINELIRACVTEPNIDLDALIAGDRNALMIAIRCTGYGSAYKPAMDCPKCGAQTEQSFDLASLAIKPLEVEPVSPGANEFEYQLPKTGLKVTFKLLTGRDEEELIATQERKKKVMNNTVDTLVSDQLKAALLSANGKRERSSLALLVDNLPGQDSLALREHIRSMQPGIDMTAMFECDQCSHTEEVQIPIGIEFFWPASRG